MAGLGTTRYPFSFYSLNSGELPVYVRLFAQSARIPLTTLSGRDTTGRALDAGQLFSR